MSLRAFAADALNERNCDFPSVHKLARDASLSIATVAYAALFTTSRLQRKVQMHSSASIDSRSMLFS